MKIKKNFKIQFSHNDKMIDKLSLVMTTQMHI